jgi:hypothetical protein
MNTDAEFNGPLGGVVTIPHSVLIDGGGRVVGTFLGAVTVSGVKARSTVSAVSRALLSSTPARALRPSRCEMHPRPCCHPG